MVLAMLVIWSVIGVSIYRSPAKLKTAGVALLAFVIVVLLCIGLIANKLVTAELGGIIANRLGFLAAALASVVYMRRQPKKNT